jgi:uncharacterized membrane protein YgcG
LKTILKPQEYCYLESPWNSDPGSMIKYALQGLCVSGDLETRVVSELVGRRVKHKRSKAYFTVTEQANRKTEFTSAEKFVLSLFHKPNMQVKDVRSKLMLELDDNIYRFKNDFVYRDLRDKGLCAFRYFLTSIGRRERSNCAYLIDHLDANVDSMIRQSPILTNHLDELGSNLVFLEPITLTKIKKALPDLSALSFAQIADNSSDWSFDYFGSDWGGFDTGGDSDSGFDFDFGGGEGGGGGAGDSW